MSVAAEGFIEIGASRLEYRMVGPHPDEAATFVLLHEGLGRSACGAISRTVSRRPPGSACSPIPALATGVPAPR